MSAPFVTQLRARGDLINLVRTAGTASITIRVEMPEVWDTVKIAASADEIVSVIKSAALEVMCPVGIPGEYVLKLRGWEVLDEHASLTEAGVRDGSIFLITSRRRRPVR